jgi:plasmid stabilization system protein ParE
VILRIQPRARADAEQAAAWYEEQQPGLGIEFVLELDAAVERAMASPLAYEKILDDVRRTLLRRFPYAVYFLYESGLVEVFAILHQHRIVEEWQSRVA